MNRTQEQRTEYLLSLVFPPNDCPAMARERLVQNRYIQSREVVGLSHFISSEVSKELENTVSEWEPGTAHNREEVRVLFGFLPLESNRTILHEFGNVSRTGYEQRRTRNLALLMSGLENLL